MIANESNPQSNRANQNIVNRIHQSDIFRSYQTAFIIGTGLAFDFVAADEIMKVPYAGQGNETRFCRLLREGTGSAWETANAIFLTEARSTEDSLTKIIMAGLIESAIPVLHGATTVGYLRIGQALASEAKPEVLRGFMTQLSAKRGLYNLEALSDAYYEIPVLSHDRFVGIVGLVSAFADQLGDHVNRLMLMKQGSESAAVTRAKLFIVENLDETLSLEVVAKHSGVSPFYLCKVFKATTGMTLTQFTGRLRIEKAKKLLLCQSHSVSEVALEVGFNSLSQFNRLFSRYVGQPPTKYRSSSHETRIIQHAPRMAPVQSMIVLEAG